MVEKRTVTQVKVWLLSLNPMTDRCEARRVVAWSDDKDKLLDWYESKKVVGYQEDRFHKSFEKGSPLEWFNPMSSADGEPDHWGHGVFWEWVEEENLANVNGVRI